MCWYRQLPYAVRRLFMHSDVATALTYHNPSGALERGHNEWIIK